MQKRFISGVLALIGLSVLAVSASSPGFIGQVVQSIQLGIAPILTSGSDDYESILKDAGRSKRTARKEETRNESIPDGMLWHIVFDFSRKIEEKAAEANAKGEKGELYSRYFVRQGPLTLDQDAALKGAASGYLDGITHINQRAKEIAEIYKTAKLQQQDLSQFTHLASELKDLQAQRDSAALHHRDAVRSTLGEEVFTRFTDFLKTDFSEGASSSAENTSAIPNGFFYEGISWIFWDEAENPPLISGMSELYFYYFFPEGFYYDPSIDSFFVNLTTQSLLDFERADGYRDIFPAIAFHPTFISTRGQVYCTVTDHYGVLYDGPFPVDEIYLDTTDVCHLVGPPAPTPTPIPTPTPTPTPTPCPLSSLGCIEPTPTPTPTPPVLQVIEVGFKDDHKITRFADNTVIDPNDNEPTWVRNRPTNNQYPVAYTKGANPKVFAKFSVSPAPSQSITAQIRVKKGSMLLTPTGNVPITINSSTATVDNVTLNGLEQDQKLKHEEYDLDWEISFNGQTWVDMGESDDHKLHWLWDAPIEPTFMSFTGYETRDDPSQTAGKFPGLFDLALEWSTGKIRGQDNVDKVVAKINTLLSDRINYKPGRALETLNPLIRLTENVPGAQCADNALILYGLMRSVGIDPSVVYHWGGDTRPANQVLTRGRRHFFTYPAVPGQPDGEEEVTLRVTRPQLGTVYCTSLTDPRECVEPDPHFKYHATVGISYTENNQPKTASFDPSYGIRETAVRITEAVTHLGELKRNSDANNLLFSRDKFNPFSSITTAARCRHRFSFNINTVRPPGNFDNSPQSDFSVVRENGNWYAKGSSPTGGVTLIEPGFDLYSHIVPADYDGDGVTDAGVRNKDYPNVWQYLESSTGTLRTILTEPTYVGNAPAAGDFDGDGKADIATWRSSDGIWMIRRSSDGVETIAQWGMAGDIPVAADYDGDHKTDIAVFRPSNGTWYALSSIDGSWIAPQWGMAGDIPVPGDYNGDGEFDFAVVRPDTGVWYILYTDLTFDYGYGQVLSAGDKPVPGDYDGDGRTDVATWRASDSVWIIVESLEGTVRVEQWGEPGKGDIPVQSAYINW